MSRCRANSRAAARASTAINVIDRVTFTDRMFRAALDARWAESSAARSAKARRGADSRVLAEHLSRPLAELTRDINKRSDNPDRTRVVFLTVGALSASNPDLPTAERAAAEVSAWIARRGIDGRRPGARERLGPVAQRAHHARRSWRRC